MQYALQVFESEEYHKFRVVEIDGEPWFIAKDVATILGYANPQKAVRDHCRAARPLGVNVSFTLDPQTVIIPERDLYRLIVRSKLPSAERFEEWVFGEVLPSIRKTGSYGYGKTTPAFIKRFNDNWDRVDNGYFSVISELAIRLLGRLEHVGHIMADRAPDGKELRPDTSVGRLFSAWLQENHPTVCDNFSYYIHKTEEWEGEARQYPMSLLPLFIEYVDTVWIPEHSERYFNTRDPAALPYLPKILPSASKPRAGMTRRISRPRRV